MARGATSKPQTALWETQIENRDVEGLLDDRDDLKGKAAAARKRFEAADQRVKDELEKLDIADAPVRIGRYVVSTKQVGSRRVEAFETNPTTRLQIKLLPDDIE